MDPKDKITLNYESPKPREQGERWWEPFAIVAACGVALFVIYMIVWWN